jgi:hypothetical protein
MTLIEIMRDEISSLDDASLLLEVHRLHACAPMLAPDHAALNARMLREAELDLKRRFLRRKQRADARGRLRTYCVHLRMNEA